MVDDFSEKQQFWLQSREMSNAQYFYRPRGISVYFVIGQVPVIFFLRRFDYETLQQNLAIASS